MTACNRQHALQSIFDPRWSPSVDVQLLVLRDKGVALDRIAMALMREPKEVEQRWHHLRVVPCVRENLRAFCATSLTYPVGYSDVLAQGSEALAP